eukprot:SAG11_NODE_19914_length_456_cov_1.291317_2_plen_23_part_01
MIGLAVSPQTGHLIAACQDTMLS